MSGYLKLSVVGTAAPVLCAALAIFVYGQGAENPLATAQERALYVLENENWYKDSAYWVAQGWHGTELPRLAPSAIGGCELSSLSALLGSNLEKEARNHYLERYVTHRNDDVGRFALTRLVSSQHWTKERAEVFARGRGWDSFKIVGHYELQQNGLAERQSETPVDSEGNDAKLREMLMILDNPNWHETDPHMAKLRASHERNPPDKRTPLDGNIRNSELLAIRNVIAAEMPSERRELLLTKYLQHHNDFVRARCFVELVSSGIWGVERAVVYTRETNPTASGWHTLLDALPKKASRRSRMVIAREVLSAARKQLPEYPQGSIPQMEIDAAHVLSSSTRNSDHALIAWAVRQYPDAPRLWLTLSRIQSPADLVERARETFTDSSQPLELRAAVALVFGKNDEGVMQTVVDWIVNYVREFGGQEEYPKWREAQYAVPRDAATELKARWFDRGLTLIAVLRELPTDVLENSMDRILNAGPYMNKIVGPVFALTIPERLVGFVMAQDEASDTLYAASYLAMHYDPTLSASVRALIPNDEFSTLQEKLTSRGVESLAPTTVAIALWD